MRAAVAAVVLGSVGLLVGAWLIAPGLAVMVAGAVSAGFGLLREVRR